MLFACRGDVLKHDVIFYLVELACQAYFSLMRFLTNDSKGLVIIQVDVFCQAISFRILVFFSGNS